MGTLASGTRQVGEAKAAAGPNRQASIADAVTDLGELCRLLDLPPPTPPACRAAEGFSLLVPRPYLGRIRRGDPRDPLLLQVLPREEELHVAPPFTTDPVGEHQAEGSCGLLRKYANRALMVTTAACGVHCRFCFRRHFPYRDGPGRAGAWDRALEEIAADESIREVILSGGDPLTLDDRTLADLAGRLAEIPRLRRLRIHTRVPIVLPDRVTVGLLDCLRGTRLSPVVVVHANHPGEIDRQVAASLGRMVDGGIPVLAQTVLLKGVNDRLEVLAELLERLVDLRVMPYYVHQLDRVAGAAHFEVPEAAGRRLIEDLRARLPGYAVPRYVREVAGESSKRLLA